MVTENKDLTEKGFIRPSYFLGDLFSLLWFLCICLWGTLSAARLWRKMPPVVNHCSTHIHLSLIHPFAQNKRCKHLQEGRALRSYCLYPPLPKRSKQMAPNRNKMERKYKRIVILLGSRSMKVILFLLLFPIFQISLNGYMLFYNQKKSYVLKK